MRQNVSVGFSTVCALFLAACGPTAPAPSAEASRAAPSEAASAVPAPPPAPAAAARKVSEKNDLYEFEYAYPAAAAAIPQLAALLDDELDRAKASLLKEAREGKADAKKNDYPYTPYSFTNEWKVVTDLPGWLSLSALVGSFEGGAHGNYAYDSILWDKAAGARRKATDLFTSPAALAAAVKPAFCAALDRERAKRRQGQDMGDIAEFSQCVDPLEQTVILGSAGHKGFDRIGFLIAPYNAGPFAEGTYEITVPVTPAVLAAVRPEFRGAFEVR